MNFEKFLQDYLHYDDASQIITGLLVLLFFLLFRKIFTRMIIYILEKRRRTTVLDLYKNIIEAFEKPIKGLIVVLGLFIALEIFPQSPFIISKKAGIVIFLRIIIIILVSQGFYNAAGSLVILMSGAQKKLGIQVHNTVLPFLTNILKFIIIALAAVLVISELGYDITGLIAGLGLGGLVFALAAQDTAANIFGGLVIIMDKPFNIGDWIQTPSVEGFVQDITLRSTRIRTFTDSVSIMPNSVLAKEAIVNWSRMEKRRVNFNIGVTYSTSREKLEACVNKIRSMLENHPQVHKEHLYVYFDSFNASSLDILIYFFTDTIERKEYLEIKQEINYRIMAILEEEKVSFAFPSRSIYIENNDKIQEKE